MCLSLTMDLRGLSAEYMGELLENLGELLETWVELFSVVSSKSRLIQVSIFVSFAGITFEALRGWISLLCKVLSMAMNVKDFVQWFTRSDSTSTQATPPPPAPPQPPVPAAPPAPAWAPPVSPARPTYFATKNVISSWQVHCKPNCKMVTMAGGTAYPLTFCHVCG